MSVGGVAHAPFPQDVLEEVEDDEEMDDEEDIDDDEEEVEDEDAEEEDAGNGCLRIFVSLKDEGPGLSWTALCASLDDDEMEDDEDGADRMEMDNDDDDDDDGASHGSYYDTNDPFIDDSELFDVEKSKLIETEMKGFFVHTGDIAVVEKAAKPKPKVKAKSKAIRPIVAPDSPDHDRNVKVMIGGVRDDAFTEEMKTLRDLIASLGSKLSESESNKKPLPGALETSLMNLEERIRAVKPTERKAIYQIISDLFPSTSQFSKSSLKDRLKRMHIQWLPKKFEAAAKKILRRLKLKINKDVKSFEAAIGNNDMSAPNVTEIKKGAPSSPEKYKYRCRWDLFAPDLLELSSTALLWTNASNAAVAKPKPKSGDIIPPKVELIQVDAVRRKYFKQVVECWPSECGVTSIRLNDAYKRYSTKHGKAEEIASPACKPSPAPSSPSVSKKGSLVLGSPVKPIASAKPTIGGPPRSGSIFDDLPPDAFAEHLIQFQYPVIATSTPITKANAIKTIKPTLVASSRHVTPTTIPTKVKSPTFVASRIPFSLPLPNPSKPIVISLISDDEADSYTQL